MRYVRERFCAADPGSGRQMASDRFDGAVSVSWRAFVSDPSGIGNAPGSFFRARPTKFKDLNVAICVSDGLKQGVGGVPLA